MKQSPKIIVPLLLLSVFFGCQKERFINEEGNLVPKTVEHDPSLPAVSLNGSKFHTEAFGNPQDPMLVVLHGGPGGDYRYLLNCKAFADSGYYVVFYDQRGSGLSKREPKASYSLEIMLDDLGAIIGHYRTSPGQKVILLGQSWGAILATAYINQYPDAVQGAILGEPGGLVWQDIMDYVDRTQSYTFTSETLNDAAYIDQFLTGREWDHAVLDYKLGLLSAADGAADNPIGNEAAAPFWRAGAVANRALFDLGEREKPDWRTNLHAFNTKVLFVYSERNRAYGQAYAQHVSSAYPQVQLERINGAGHDMISFPTGWNNFFPIAINYLKSI